MNLTTRTAFAGFLLMTTTFAFGGRSEKIHNQQPTNVKITAVTSAGNGCKGKISAKLIGNEILRLDTGRLEAKSGPYISRRQFREFCQVSIELSYPRGWTYAPVVGETKLEGYLSRGVRGSASLLYYFQGQSEDSYTTFDYRGTKTINSNIAGPLRDAHFAPCGQKRSINIKQSVMVRGSRYSFGALSIKGPTHLVLAWKKCQR